MSSLLKQSLPKLDHLISDAWESISHCFRPHEHVAPRVDVREVAGEYRISVELPGIERENIRVSLEGGILSVDAYLFTADDLEPSLRVMRCERHYGHYHRSFDLTTHLMSEKAYSTVIARFNNGVLALTIPKHAESSSYSGTVTIN